MTYYRVMKHNGNGWNTVSGHDDIAEATTKYNETIAKFPNDIIAIRAKHTGRLPYILCRSDED